MKFHRNGQMGRDGPRPARGKARWWILGWIIADRLSALRAPHSASRLTQGLIESSFPARLVAVAQW